MQPHLQRPQKLFAHPVRYEIPAFQRRYVWRQEEQWEPLWNDVEQLAESIMERGKAEPHFMGAVVFQQKYVPTGTIEHRIVVDGQQRLTTLQLLIDAIQEILQERGHSSPAERLSVLVKNQKAFRDGKAENAFKVWPTIVDQAAFRHAMDNDLSSGAYASSRILQAHDYFRAQAAGWLDRFPENTDVRDKSATALEGAVCMSLELVVIDLGSEDEPHVIFETLNARGTPLLQSDMVKNKILHEAGVGTSEDDREVLEEVSRLWPFQPDGWWARDVGRGLQRRPRIDVYLNHWLTLRNRRDMKPYDEFSAFTKYVEERHAAGSTIEDVARDMGGLGRIYRDLEEWRQPEIANFLKRLHVMNVGVITPLLLWLLSAELPPATLSNSVKALESYLVRRVVCGLSARGYGSLFVGLIEKSAEGQPHEADHVVVTYLAGQTGQGTLWPTDGRLRDQFLEEQLYQYLTRGRLRMVLSAIEEELRTDKAESRDLPEGLQIEHIMPQAWEPNWPLTDDDDGEGHGRRVRALHTIGNLTLVNGRLNKSLSNAPWEDTRQTLADHSVLFLNKWLVNAAPQVWNEDGIRERAKRFFSEAVKVWPHHADFEMAGIGGPSGQGGRPASQTRVDGSASAFPSSDSGLPSDLSTAGGYLEPIYIA